MIVGAYLTQNTAWTNVERALANLRRANLLSVEGIRAVKLSRLQRLIRPSGYFRQKAKRLKTFVAFLDDQYEGSLQKLFSEPTEKLREELLSLNGVGPETADSILLYAGNHPVFVVDAYTRRILDRHGIVPEKTEYEEIRQLFQISLEPIAAEQERGPAEVRQTLESGIRGAAHPPSVMSTAHRTALVQVYNEMHGLIVGVGKNYCRKAKPACEECPLQKFLPDEVVDAAMDVSPLAALPPSPPGLELRIPPRRFVMKIQGIEGMSPDRLQFEIQRGAKFVFYQYAISVLVMSFRRSSDIYFIPAGESSITKGLPWSLISLVAGWWGIPWGPIFTIQSLVTNFKGGKDVTAELSARLTQAPAPAAVAAKA